jgi:hypothetical protein
MNSPNDSCIANLATIAQKEQSVSKSLIENHLANRVFENRVFENRVFENRDLRRHSESRSAECMV